MLTSLQTTLLQSSGPRRLLAGVGMAVLVLMGGTASAQWAGEEIVQDGVLHVRNPPTAQQPPLTLELEELWRIGGESEEPGEFFGLITDIAIESSGDVFLLDRQLCEVKVFSGDGAYLRTIGREGEGPGEFRRPSSLFFMPSGDVAIVRSRPSGVVLLTPDGDPLAPYPLPNSDDGGFRSVLRGSFRGGSLVLLGNNRRRAQDSMERTMALVRMDMQGNEVVRFQEQTTTSSRASTVVREAESLGWLWTVRPDGSVIACLDSDYRILVWSADGALERVIDTDYDTRVRSATERQERQDQLVTRNSFRRHRRAPSGLKIEVSDTDRDIQWLEVTEDGSLWVLPSRGVFDALAGTVGPFDVYDSAGHFFQRVTLRVDANFAEDRLFMTADRLFVIKEFAAAERAMRGIEVADEELDSEEFAEPMSVICYRFEWMPQRAVAVPTN